MTLEIIGALLVLALVDSTSFGTLLIPIWLLLTPGRIRARRVLVFLGTVAAFYLLLGLVLALGAQVLLDEFAAAARSTPVLVVQLVLGAALVVLGLTIEPWTKAGKEKKRARRAAREAEHGPGRATRMRQRAMDADAPLGAVVGLAVAAAAVEAASMLPYLAAIGLIVSADLALGTTTLVLVGYCLVMVLPASILLGLRLGLHQRIEPLLARIEAWLSRNSGEAIAWVLFLVGLYLAAGAAQDLGWTS
ncbi:GAP family protein [Nocardioides sp. AE5]|uniref:GAP family protein n=1 Tax=Nocardioides sp. AE5 TaxID=2962573 RepID=UPI002881FC46|nr:GAP family protein [Nocardioides sp. AE5]MDT0200526.1 GAP family protein [Nocardioides sp. AE5]